MTETPSQLVDALARSVGSAIGDTPEFMAVRRAFEQLQADLIATHKERDDWKARAIGIDITLEGSNERLRNAEQALALRGEQWIELIRRIGKLVNCLYSTSPDGNEHIVKKISELAALRGEPVAWGLPNSSITGKGHALMQVELEFPSDDEYGGAMWVPLVLGAAPISGEREQVNRPAATREQRSGSDAGGDVGTAPTETAPSTSVVKSGSIPDGPALSGERVREALEKAKAYIQLNETGVCVHDGGVLAAIDLALKDIQ